MAMTKKEREEFDAAIMRANTLAALRWTDVVEKDLPVPSPSTGAVINGFSFNVYSASVSASWSASVYHGNGTYSDRKGCASQGGVSLYSTRLLALRGLRNAVERESAKKLREIDEMIEKERQK